MALPRKTYRKEEKNPIVKQAHDYFEYVKQQYLRNIGEHAVRVRAIQALERPQITPWGTIYIGKMLVELPRSYAEIRIWNGSVFEWHDFADYDLDATKPLSPFDTPPYGSGRLVLWVRSDKKGNKYVTLPKTRGKNGIFYDVIRTRDCRSETATYDNNRNLEAALTAFLRYGHGEFVQENPKNRFGLNESCMTCRYMAYLQVNDGIYDNLLDEKDPLTDMYKKDLKSRAILQQPDVMQLGQYGQLQPQALCLALEEFVDLETVDEANAEAATEKSPYLDENGQYRFLDPDEILIAGRPMKIRDIRVEGTKEICANCPFYHMNVYKGEVRIGKEKVESGGQYVSPYWKTQARPGRQIIQVLVKKDGQEEWVTQHAGEHYPNAKEFRIKGIGVTVYGTEELMSVFRPGAPFRMEDVDFEKASVQKDIKMMYQALLNWRELSVEAKRKVISMSKSKPNNLDPLLSQKWDRVAALLQNAVISDQQKEQNQELSFPQKFFAESRPGALELPVQEVMSRIYSLLAFEPEEFKQIDEEDPEQVQKRYEYRIRYGIEYEDLSPQEFVRRLDEVADDIIYKVIEDDVEFVLVGGTEKDRKLAASALQHKLQTFVNRLLYGVRRSFSPIDALAGLKKASFTVRQYIKENLR